YSEHEGAHEDLLYHLANALMLEGTFSEDVARDLALDVQQSDDVDLLKAGIKWGLLFGHGGMTHACVMALLDGAMHEPCDHDRWNFSYLVTLNVLANGNYDKEACAEALLELSAWDASERTLIDRLLMAALAAASGDKQLFRMHAKEVLALSRDPELPIEARGDVGIELHCFEEGFLSDPRPFIPGH